MAATEKPQKELTPRQALFVEEYLRDRNGTQAAIRAGFSAKSASKTAWELLNRPQFRSVQEAIQERTRDLARTTGPLQEALRRKWASIALGRPKDILPPEGEEAWTMEALRELPDEVWDQIQTIRQTTYTDHEGRDVTKIEIKFINPLVAGKLLGTHLGMLKTQVDVSGSIDLEGASAELSGALDRLRASREEIASVVARALAEQATRLRGESQPES